MYVCLYICLSKTLMTVSIWYFYVSLSICHSCQHREAKTFHSYVSINLFVFLSICQSKTLFNSVCLSPLTHTFTAAKIKLCMTMYQFKRLYIYICMYDSPFIYLLLFIFNIYDCAFLCLLIFTLYIYIRLSISLSLLVSVNFFK